MPDPTEIINPNILNQRMYFVLVLKLNFLRIIWQLDNSQNAVLNPKFLNQPRFNVKHIKFSIFPQKVNIGRFRFKTIEKI